MPRQEWIESKNILSNWSVWWMTNMLVYGSRNTIEQSDFPPLHEDNRAATISARFDVAYRRELSKNAASPNVLLAVTRALGWYYLKPWITVTISCALSVFVPIFLVKNIVLFVSTGSQDYLAGGLYIAGFFVAVTLQSLLRERSFLYTVIAGLRARAVVMIAVYNKATRLQSMSSTVGEIVSMQSNDAYRVHELFRWGVFPYCVVIVLIAVFVLLVLETGWMPAVIGISVELAIYVPLQVFIGKYMTTKRRDIARITDRRVRAMNEILGAMKLVKLYNWEKSFTDRVNSTRHEEMKEYRRISIAKTFNLLAATLAPLCAVYAIFVTLSLTGVALTPALVFTVSSLLDSAKFYLDFLPPSVKGVTEGLVGLKRMGHFLSLPEVEDKRIVDKEAREGQVHFQGATFRWPAAVDPSASSNDATLTELNDQGIEQSSVSVNAKRVTLKDIDLEVKPGELLAIVGPVGSGKSSLLAGVVGQLPLVNGALRVDGKIAYATQQAWMTNESLRNNVLFSSPLDEERYAAALSACQLLPDLEQLPAGDRTEIGERGINLSGGQKQRVSLARAVYSNRDVYLLDDVLSAVDQHVGKKLFTKCIKGALESKTRLFVTNQLQYLPACDRVAVLRKGEIVALGRYDELVAKNVDFGVPLESKQEKKDKNKLESTREDKMEEMQFASPPVALKATKIGKALTNQEFTAISGKLDLYKQKAEDGKLMVAEDREHGSVNMSVYMSYVRSAGPVAYSVMVALLFVIGQLGRLFPDLWFSWWVQHRYGVDNIWYIWIYACLIGGTIVTLISRNAFLTLWTISAASHLHDAVFARVLRAPMRFFDSTPLGRILNRFTKDLDLIDDQLPNSLFNIIYATIAMLATVGLVCAVLPWFIIAIVVALVFFVIFARFYSNSSRQLKRIDSISRSPIYSHLSATLTGLITIRGYELADAFIVENFRRIDRNLETSFYYEMSARWLVLRMEWICAFLIAAVAALMVFTPALDPATSALALTYSMGLAHLMATFIRAAVDAENQFTSVERLTHYSTKLDMEADLETPVDGPQLSQDWPQHGKIAFENVEARYRPDGDPIIRDLSFTSKPAEKIGIVGRTGAGKSTLVLTLFRLIELSQGRVFIDGIDIAQIGLGALRSKLGIIPQEPVLFTGTIRSNLDPFQQASDEQIWSALEKVHLADDVSASPQKLETIVVENGDNFSVGQRQLLCIARALLRNSKILVLDEATASIDLNTDNLIQKTIRESFVGCTVLTIAHRLHTIIDSDRILVLERGQLVEFAPPYDLLRNRKSFFSKLVSQTGKKEAAKLKQMAKDMYNLVLDASPNSSPAASPKRDDSSGEEGQPETKERKGKEKKKKQGKGKSNQT